MDHQNLKRQIIQKRKVTQEYIIVLVKKLDEFSLQNVDLVGLNSGILANDYTLLNPPLGKGLLLFIIYY